MDWSAVKYRVGQPNFGPAVVSWRSGVDPFVALSEILAGYRDLLNRLERAPDASSYEGERSWIQERLRMIDQYALPAVSFQGADAQNVVEEVVHAAALHEELDQLFVTGASDIVRRIVQAALSAIAIEKC